ncbi:MAG TPA: chitooligosaccharide deacetylase [Lachnospiraceae bacterium]|jgi:polysaccharide deacetylase family sporulation protein PdaB|nr:chitooligosaccharide deacetylase [Lachnospiraceae bacterium]HCA69778.1 chitooligosaccharide deacetylase [Lachnospiraceae bacterium]HCM12160.1 chitooligosaccharide deacetylase [Lachnospiraceae bacterium]HCR39316.1 chitooligosaccharide deacetylase [Lachnospiraceae bacterium]
MRQKEKKPDNKEPLEGAILNDESLEKELLDISLFVKIGIIVLSVLLVIGLGIKFLPGAISVSSAGRNRDLPIYCVDTDEKKVALSFDAAWGNEDTRNILDILAKHNIKVTFFMTGGWVNKYPDDVKAIAAAGHDLGNHSENHKQMSRLSKEECVEEIMKPHNRVKELTGVEMKLFRPPYGDYNNTLVGAARDCGYYTIQWDVDSLDWKDYGVQSIIQKCTQHKHLGNGSIILMHNGAKYTPEALDTIITELQNQGYELVPISQLIHTGEYTIDHEGRQHKK